MGLGAHAMTQGVANIQNSASGFEFRQIKNNAFKAGEKLTYLMHYGFIDAGKATLEVKSTEKKVNGRELLHIVGEGKSCLLYTSPSPRDLSTSRMPSSA